MKQRCAGQRSIISEHLPPLYFQNDTANAYLVFFIDQAPQRNKKAGSDKRYTINVSSRRINFVRQRTEAADLPRPQRYISCIATALRRFRSLILRFQKMDASTFNRS